MHRSLRSLALTFVLGALACNPSHGGPGGWDRGDGKADAEEQSTPVVTTRVERGSMVATISAASTIEAEQQVTVHAEATGRIIALSFEEGDEVKVGQLLARVKYDAQSSGLNRAETNYQKAKSDFERIESLFQRKVVSKEELDSARIAFETASIDVRDRERDVKNTRVSAPFSGTVTQRLVNEGAFVTSGQQLLSIVDFETLVARVYVPEKELDRIRVGQPATVTGKAAKGRQGIGTVTRIAPVVDAGTGTVKVTVALPKELAGGPTGFLPGMYAEVTLETERRENVVLVPKQALVHDEDQAFVFVADGSRARRVQIETGLSNTAQIEVVGGVEVGAEIVIVGQAGLRDGGLLRRVDEEGKPLEADPAAKDDSSPAVAADSEAPKSRPQRGARRRASEGA